MDRYRLLAELSPDGLIVHQDGVVVYVNPATLRLAAAGSPTELLGRSIVEFVHVDDVGPMLERLRSLDHDGAISGPAEVRIMALDGSISTVDVTSVRTTWQGRPAMQAIMRDLAAVKAASAALAYEAALVAHVSDAIIGLDKCGLVTSWNPAAEAIYGWSGSETLGRPVLHFLQTLPPVGQSGQVHHQSRDGRTVVARASVSELRDSHDQVTGAVIICSDETARLRADQQYATVVANLQEGICVISADTAGWSRPTPPPSDCWGCPAVSSTASPSPPSTCGTSTARTFPGRSSERRSKGQRHRGPGHASSACCSAEGSPLWLSANARPLFDERRGAVPRRAVLHRRHRADDGLRGLAAPGDP